MKKENGVGQGLSILFWGAILCGAGSVLAMLLSREGLSAGIVLAGDLVTLCGLFLMARTVGRYWTAFTCSVAQLFLWSVSHFAVNLTSMPALSAAADVLSLLLSLLLVHCVCVTTSGLLDPLDRPGAKEAARRGREVWKLYLYSSITMMVCEIFILLLDSSISQMLLSIPALIAALIGLIASVLYLIFLFQSQKVFLA